MLIGIHAMAGTEMRNAMHLTDSASLVAKAFNLKIRSVFIAEPPQQHGMPNAILHVTLWKKEEQDANHNRFVQLQQIEYSQSPEYRFELARTEASRRLCPVHKKVVEHLDVLASLAQEFAANRDALIHMFLVEDNIHHNAFIAADIQRANADLTAFFRSFK